MTLADQQQLQQQQRSTAGASTSSSTSNIVSLGDLQSALAANKSLMPEKEGDLQAAIKMSMQGRSEGNI